MASYFLDTSALAKHYHAEHGTDKVDAREADASVASVPVTTRCCGLSANDDTSRVEWSVPCGT